MGMSGGGPGARDWRVFDGFLAAGLAIFCRFADTPDFKK